MVLQWPGRHYNNASVQKFLHKSMDENGDTKFTKSGIYEGIKHGDSKTVLKCIRNGDDITAICPRTGFSFVHLVVAEANSYSERKFVPIIYQLSNANVNLDVLDKTETTPLQLSIRRCLPEIMTALLKCCAKVSPEVDEGLIIKYGKYSTTDILNIYRRLSPGYWIPVENNNAFKVNVLIKCWCRINIARNGQSLIEYAKQIGANSKITKQLVDNEGSVEFAHAIMAGDEVVMNNLLHHSIDFGIRDHACQDDPFAPFSTLSLYSAAEKYGHSHVLHLLPNIPNNLSPAPKNTRTDNRSNTSQFCAIL